MVRKVKRELGELLDPGEPVIVAVSGGVDSMVLLHLLREAGHPCTVAHVDHGLRGEESDADREFVLAHCAANGIPALVHRVDVLARVAATGESKQMAARELRRAWFDGLAAKGPTKVALAHHADDAMETLFMGLMQGMGLHGWEGIPARKGPLIRPLLAVARQEILAYAAANAIAWREDASNADTDHLRNRVRHELIPLLEQWRPGTRRDLFRNARLLRELAFGAQAHLADTLRTIAVDEHGVLRVPFDRVLGDTPLLVLYHLLRDKGFHPDRFDQLVRAMQEQRTGSVFHGPAHTVLVDRNELVIRPVSDPPPAWIVQAFDEVPEDAPIRLFLPANAAVAQGRAEVFVDRDRVTFPLVLRPWKAGDRMRPVGTGGSKLVSDILIDAKVPRDRKARTYVLLQHDRIIWLCGHRLAEGFGPDGSTARILGLQWSGD